MATEIDGAADIDRKIGIYLDQAVGIALVPVIARLGLVIDVLDDE